MTQTLLSTVNIKQIEQYESPEMQVVEIEIEGAILDGSIPNMPKQPWEL